MQDTSASGGVALPCWPVACLTSVIPLLLATGWTLTARAADIVTSCGQAITADRIILGADLDCTGLEGPVIDAPGKAKVNLAGFTITGGWNAIRAERACKVFSDPTGATLTGQVRTAIACGQGAGAIDGGAKVEDVAIVDGTGELAIDADGRMRLKRVTIRNWGGGVFAWRSGKNGMKIIESTIDNVAGTAADVTAFQSATMNVRDSFITNNAGNGLEANGKIYVRDSVITGNDGDGVATPTKKTINIKDCDVSGNGGFGVWARKVSVSRSTVLANALGGILALDDRIRLRHSTATGNGTSPDCGVTAECADLIGSALPSVSGTSSCESSHVLNSGLPGTSWGVCSLD